MKKKYKIKGMNCPSCADLLEMEIEDIGVKGSCNYYKQTLETEYNSDFKKKEKEVIELLEKKGYSIFQS